MSTLESVHAAGGHEVGVRHAGRADGVDPDAEGRRLDGDRLGQLVHRALGRAVDRPAPADEPGDRTGVEDDPAVTLLLELDHGVLAAEEDAAEVDRDEPLEVLDGVVLERHAETRRRDADVVEHDVEAAEAVHRAGDGRGHVASSCDTSQRSATAVAAGSLDLGHRLLGPVQVDVGADDRGALLGEAQRRRPADAGAGPSDDRDLVLEQHRLTPSSSSAQRAVGRRRPRSGCLDRHRGSSRPPSSRVVGERRRRVRDADPLPMQSPGRP